MPKNWTFYHLCFLGKSSRKRSFLNILDNTKIFEKSSKKSKFSKAVSPWFLSKNRIFYHVYFWGKSSKKRSFFYVLDKKECFLDQKEEVLKNSKNIEIFKGSMVFVKQWNFYHLFFFLANQSRKECFGIFWIRQCFLDKEKEVLQKSKNSIFSMVFVKKLNFLSSVFFGRIKPEKIVFWDFGYKGMLFRPENWSFKKVQKIEIWKNAIFPTFLTSCSDSLKKLKSSNKYFWPISTKIKTGKFLTLFTKMRD